MEKLTHCVACKNEGLTDTTDTRTRVVAGYTFEVELPLQVCPSCGEGYYHDATVEDYEMRIAAWLAEHGDFAGEAFQFMRKALGMRAADLATLLDVAPETLSRWEKEHRPTDRNAFYILASVVLDKTEGHDRTLRRMRSLQEPKAVELHVDLNLSPSPV